MKIPWKSPLEAADPPPGGDGRPRGAATRDPGVSDVGKCWNQDGNMMHIWWNLWNYSEIFCEICEIWEDCLELFKRPLWRFLIWLEHGLFQACYHVMLSIFQWVFSGDSVHRFPFLQVVTQSWKAPPCPLQMPPRSRRWTELGFEVGCEFEATVASTAHLWICSG